eukprot:5991362-Alexandrium_andersonii.AAC.1
MNTCRLKLAPSVAAGVAVTPQLRRTRGGHAPGRGAAARSQQKRSARCDQFAGLEGGAQLS